MIELNIDNPTAKNVIVQQLANAKNCVIVCIGTQKVVADSLGPMVGTLLNENMPAPVSVYGMQNANITAQNLEEAFRFIKMLHPNQKLIVIDAAVGEQNQIGKVQISNTPLFPGAATNKSLSEVGDVSIVGIVAHKNMQDFYTDSCERRILVEKLAQFIAGALAIATK